MQAKNWDWRHTFFVYKARVKITNVCWNVFRSKNEYHLWFLFFKTWFYSNLALNKSKLNGYHTLLYLCINLVVSWKSWYATLDWLLSYSLDAAKQGLTNCILFFRKMIFQILQVKNSPNLLTFRLCNFSIFFYFLLFLYFQFRTKGKDEIWN